MRSRATVVGLGIGSWARLDLPIATSSGVNPCLVLTFRSAPCSTRNCTTLSAPRSVAPCSAVSPTAVHQTQVESGVGQYPDRPPPARRVRCRAYSCRGSRLPPQTSRRCCRPWWPASGSAPRSGPARKYTAVSPARAARISGVVPAVRVVSPESMPLLPGRLAVSAAFTSTPRSSRALKRSSVGSGSAFGTATWAAPPCRSSQCPVAAQAYCRRRPASPV